MKQSHGTLHCTQITVALLTHHSLCQKHPDLQQSDVVVSCDAVGLTTASHVVPEMQQLSLDLNAQRGPVYNPTAYISVKYLTQKWHGMASCLSWSVSYSGK